MKVRALLVFLALWGVWSQAGAAQVPYTEALFADLPRLRPIQVELSVPNLLVGSVVVLANFELSRTVTVGPLLGFYPIYFWNPGNPTFAYDVGVDSNWYVFGDRFSNSGFVNIFSYLSGSHSERAEQPSVHSGLNLGYRWVFLKETYQTSWILTLGAGVKCIYSHLEAFSYRPSGRVSEGSIDTFIPFSPSMKVTVGLFL